MEKQTRKFQLDFEDMQSKLRSQKDQELRDQRDKYDR
jgi:colicin import membrane protein